MRSTRILLAAAFVATIIMACVTDRIAADGRQDDAGYVKVEAKGKLVYGVLAPGGQTTGVIVETGKMNVELDFGTNEKLRDQAKELNGKMVVTHGHLTTKLTTNKSIRVIIQVTSLKETK